MAWEAVAIKLQFRRLRHHLWMKWNDFFSWSVCQNPTPFILKLVQEYMIFFIKRVGQIIYRNIKPKIDNQTT